MKQTTKRIFMSVLTLLLTAVAVGTTTVAWFAIGSIVNVSKVRGQVRSDEGLDFQIILKDADDVILETTGWKSTFTANDWQTLFNAELDGKFRFEALELNANAGGFFNKLNQLGTGAFEFQDNAVRNIDYLEFDIRFRSESGGFVHLDDIGFTSTQIKWETDVDFLGFDGVQVDAGEETDLFYPHEALRVTLDDDVTYFNGHTVNKANGQWSYLGAKGTVVNGYYDTEEFEIDGVTPNANYQTLTTPRDYSGVVFDRTVDAEDVPTSYQNGYAVALVEDNGVWYVTINVKVWIDGWDPHTFNAIFDEWLEFNLRFRKLAVDLIL